MRSRLAVPTFLVLLCATACAPTSTPTSPASSSPQRTTDKQPSTPPTRTSPSEPAPEPTRDPFAAAFVEAHDRARTSVSPSADPALPPMQWSEELAASARAWAQRCEFRHGESDYGENLAARTDQAEPAAVVSSWVDEAQHFDHRRNRCASGEVCGHYTQVVWRDSTTIGCAVARCSGGGPFGGGEWFMWVCNYSPPGNWKGERPY